MPKSRTFSRKTKIFFLSGGVLTIIFCAILAVAFIKLSQMAAYAENQLQTFFSAAQTAPTELITLGIIGWHSTPVQTEGRKNILVLGLDSLSTRGDAPPLTDTIMIVSLDLKTGEASAISLPRDIYIEELQTRINTLYWYGNQQEPDNPKRLPTTTISELTGIPIHHTVVLTLDEVGQLIDLLGGITMDVPLGFVDEMFPRTDVDVTVERDPAKLYERIEFVAGEQTFDGPTALKYIRSRHGEGTEGTDLARSRRQQLVITSLLKKMSDLSLYKNPHTAGTLVRFYRQHFAQDFPTTELIATLRQLLPVRNSITFSGTGVSVYPEEAEGVLFHPPLSAYRGQWLYVIRDEVAFKNEIQQKLKLVKAE
jgi:LCP family protein required for cell wall assembly